MNQVKSRTVERDMSRKCHSKNMEKSTIPLRRSSTSPYHFYTKRNKHIVTCSHFITCLAESNEKLTKCFLIVVKNPTDQARLSRKEEFGLVPQQPRVHSTWTVARFLLQKVLIEISAPLTPAHQTWFRPFWSYTWSCKSKDILPPWTLTPRLPEGQDLQDLKNAFSGKREACQAHTAYVPMLQWFSQ